jgi:hypothetical protein
MGGPCAIELNAREASWREDNRRISKGQQVHRVAGLAMVSKPSVAGTAVNSLAMAVAASKTLRISYLNTMASPPPNERTARANSSASKKLDKSRGKIRHRRQYNLELWIDRSAGRAERENSCGDFIAHQAPVP